MKRIIWCTTEPNPRSPTTGYDAGQRGWRVHAVIADPSQSFDSIKLVPALCGLTPAHGWGMDLFIDRKCARCAKAIDRVDAELTQTFKQSKQVPPRPQMAGLWWKTAAATFASCPNCRGSIMLETVSPRGRAWLSCPYVGCDGAWIIKLEGWQ